jgi:hypothetical protein
MSFALKIACLQITGVPTILQCPHGIFTAQDGGLDGGLSRVLGKGRSSPKVRWLRESVIARLLDEGPIKMCIKAKKFSIEY